MTRQLIRTVEALRTAADTFLASAAKSAASSAPSEPTIRKRRQQQHVLRQQHSPPRHQLDQTAFAPSAAVRVKGPPSNPVVPPDLPPVASTSRLDPPAPAPVSQSSTASPSNSLEGRSRSVNHEALYSEAGKHDAGRAESEMTESVSADRSVMPTPEELSASLPAAMSSSSVPSSRLGRLFQYGGLAVSLGWGTAQATLGGLGGKSKSPAYMSEANIRRIVKTLSRMRGAALKVGQFISIQDTKLLPPEVEDILSRVQNAADYMPLWQTEQVLVSELGPDWRSHFAEFDERPMAAASIGQVHRAVLQNGDEVAVKIQFPGISKSINADLGYLRTLLSLSAFLPKGLFLENSLRVLSREMHDECDYRKEAEACQKFGQFLKDDPHLRVPRVYTEVCTQRVLTLEMMKGTSLAKSRSLSQKLRDHIGEQVLRLCLREVLEFRFMQTDPNWSNFLWNASTQKLELVDFGASRPYTSDFVDVYRKMLVAAISEDRKQCQALSRTLGFLVEEDNEVMIDAHVESMIALAEPFRTERYSFRDQTITSRIKSYMSAILQNRNSPPPEATYSLHRKLSGCFLLCAKLESNIACRSLLQQIPTL